MAALDVSQAGQTAGKYGIKTIPTTIFFANGKEIGRVEGGMTKTELFDEIFRLSGGTQPQKGPVPTTGPAAPPTPAPMPAPTRVMAPSGSSSTLVAVGSIAAAALLTVLLVR